MNSRLSKTISILAIVSLLAAGSALAQNQRGGADWQKGPPSVEEKLARISAALNLTGDQSLEMLEILLAQADKRAAIHEQAMALIGPEICTQQAENEEAILTILDEEQAALFMQMIENRKESAGQNDRRGRIRNELDCSD